MNTFLFLIILGLLVWFWQDSLRHREYAIQQCKNACKEMELQLLDQTIALRSISLKRDSKNTLKFMRRYTFEFSINGIDRYKGYIVLHGGNIEHTQFDHPDGPIIMQNQNLSLLH